MKMKALVLFALCLASVSGFAAVEKSPRLSIVRASYGVGDQGIDVTEPVRSLVSHGVVFLRAPWSLGSEDPAPGQVKTVTIVYNLDGVQQTVTLNQKQNIALAAEPDTLTVVSAKFGVAERRVDVTEALRAHQTVDGSLRIFAGWFLGAVDPALGIVKDVEIVYLDHGTPKTATFKQTQEVLLPEKDSYSRQHYAPVPSQSSNAPQPTAGTPGASNELQASRHPGDIYPLWSIAGEWRVTHPDWTGIMRLQADGTAVIPDQASSGRWSLGAEGGTPLLVIRWDKYGTDSFAMVNLNHFREQCSPGRFVDMRRGE